MAHLNMPRHAPCAGTTFLFHELVARHPRIKSHRVDICTPQRTKVSVPMKEPHYFDRIPLGSLDKYMDRYRINGCAFESRVGRPSVRARGGCSLQMLARSSTLQTFNHDQPVHLRKQQR